MLRRLRRVRAVALAAVAAVVITGCGEGDGSGRAGASGAPASDGGFPVTVTHAQGKATVPRKPERVIALGFADAQIAAALDAPVVGVARNTAAPDGNWPGVSPAYPKDVVTLDSLNPNLEKIAALDPDLILMTTAQPAFGTAYAKLSAIAPVVSYKEQLLHDSGDELTRLIGAALGEEEKAQKLIDSSREALTAFARKHPGLKGKRYAFGQQYSGTVYAVVARGGPTATFFGELGMALPKELASLEVAAGGGAPIAPERLDLLDTADVAFFGVYGDDERAKFTKRPLVADLALVKDRDLHFLDLNEAMMLLGPNPAVTEGLLDRLGPALAAAAS
ncbi:ABC transporter substrate-binding protein [Streptomyces sp. NPDC005955]|uniref:ABC transporter substrate-binding protein n=1 Tax=Streptomyces sp. NPDC005955 TaxID=3364738 RepID=UPI00368C581C